MSKNTKKQMETAKEKPEGYVFGRPNLYRDKYVQMMEDYFNIPVGTCVIPEQVKRQPYRLVV